MDTIIFSASPLKAFSGGIFAIVFMFLVALMSAFAAIFPGRGRNKVFTRIGAGFSAIILSLAGIGMTVATYNSFQNGDETVLVRVEEKNEVTRKCNDYYCTDYVLDTTDGNKYYAFGVEKHIWDVIEVNGCYRFTYYPIKPLLADYLQDDNYPDLYEATGDIIQIERVNCP